jgi:hypothetical protein
MAHFPTVPEQSIPENVIQRLVCQHSDFVSFEIVTQLSGAHDYGITYLLYLRIILLGTQRNTKYISTCCESFLPSLHTSLSCTMAPLTAVWVAKTYGISG